MELSPEERRKIYEEEKAKIEVEQRQRADRGRTSTDLPPNVAGLLCYLAGWITGIIFLILEPDNRFVRFHAIQSIVTFGSLTVAGLLLGWIPIAGSFFGAIIGTIGFVLWIVLMVKAYQGELFKIPVAGDVAGSVTGAEWFNRSDKTDNQKQDTESDQLQEVPVNEPVAPGHVSMSKMADKFGKGVDSYFTKSRAGRIAGYTFAILWNVASLIFFSFFYRYIAWYHTEPDGSVTRLPMLTNEYTTWLPIFITAVLINIAANIIMIVYDRFWLRNVIQIILNLIGIVVIASLVSIFPFDFSVIPNGTAADVVPVAVTIGLILIAVALGIGVLVQFIRLIVGITKQDTGSI